MTQEELRLHEDRERKANWKRWGPYLSERQWGTVREDYSAYGAAWDSFSRGSAIRRAGRAGFARNVCVGLGNRASPDAVPGLSAALADAEPLVRAHAAWALGRVGSAEARSALSSRASLEADASVLDEITAAMDA